MTGSKSVYNEGFASPFFKAFFSPYLRPILLKTLYSIFKNFFLAQHRGAFLPGRIPVKNVDHPLDGKIPFVPKWIKIYIDFVQFWVRIVSFCFNRYGRKGYKKTGAFIASMGGLYAYAARVYTKSFSTTTRPFYIARPRFLMVHLLDPHLMCIPSLHVMIVIHAYTMFEFIAKQNNDGQNLREQIQEIKHGALAITQAVLFVKQHSVNCIPAALYAMSRFTPELFPPEEAYNFTEKLFSPAPCEDSVLFLKSGKIPSVHPASSPKTTLPEADINEIKKHILSLYNRFMEEGKKAKNWEEPLVNFLRTA